MYVYIYMYIKWWIGCSTQTILTVYQHSLIGNVRIIYLIYPLLPKMAYRNVIFPTPIYPRMRRKKPSIPKKLSPHRLRGTRFSLFPLRLLFPPYPKDLGCPHISLPPRWGGNALEMGSSPFGVGCNVCSRKNARGQAEIGVSSWNGRKRFHRGSLLRAVMVTGCRSFCNRCVQLRRLALPRTANRYSAPETGSTLRRRRGRD